MAEAASGRAASKQNSSRAQSQMSKRDDEEARKAKKTKSVKFDDNSKAADDQEEEAEQVNSSLELIKGGVVSDDLSENSKAQVLKQKEDKMKDLDDKLFFKMQDEEVKIKDFDELDNAKKDGKKTDSKDAKKDKKSKKKKKDESEDESELTESEEEDSEEIDDIKSLKVGMSKSQKTFSRRQTTFIGKAPPPKQVHKTKFDGAKIKDLDWFDVETRMKKICRAML